MGKEKWVLKIHLVLEILVTRWISVFGIVTLESWKIHEYSTGTHDHTSYSIIGEVCVTEYKNFFHRSLFDHI